MAAHLNNLIIRGSYTERAVIFNVYTLNGLLVRKLKLLAYNLQKLPVPISVISIYLDPGRSDYCLEEAQPSDNLKFKKLSCKTDFTVSHKGFRYSYHLAFIFPD